MAADDRPDDLETKTTPVAPRATPVDDDRLDTRSAQVPNISRTGDELTQAERDAADGYGDADPTATTASARKATTPRASGTGKQS